MKLHRSTTLVPDLAETSHPRGLASRIRPRARAFLAALAVFGIATAVAQPADASGPRIGGALAPVSVRQPTARGTGPAITAPPRQSAESVAAMRQEIIDFVAAAGVTAAPAGAPARSAIVPAAEAAAAIRALPDAEVARIHDVLPIIHDWPEIRDRMIVSPAPAPRDQRQGQRTFTPSQEQALEEFRSDLDGVYVVRETWAPLVGGSDPAYVARLEDGRKLVRDATLEDLAAMQESLAWMPNWQDTLAPDLAGLLGPGGLASLAPGPGGGEAVPLVTTEQCSEADYTRNVLPMIIAEAVLKSTAVIEDYAAGFFTNDIKICFGIFLVTVCVDFPNPVFLILKGLHFATNRVTDALDAVIEVTNLCQAMVHWRKNVEHRDSFLTSAQSVLEKLITRHNELVERTEIIDFANREAWKLQLQLAIEENLLEPLPDPSGIDENRISLFQLTDTVCFNPDELLPTPVPPLPTPNLATPATDVDPPPDLAVLPTPMAPSVLSDRREQCGIELVKRIVDEAIQLNKLAGNEIHDAESNFAAANQHFAAGRYKEAYLRYRQAYQAAVQPDAEPRGLLSVTPDR